MTPKLNIWVILISVLTDFYIGYRYICGLNIYILNYKLFSPIWIVICTITNLLQVFLKSFSCFKPLSSLCLQHDTESFSSLMRPKLVNKVVDVDE